MRTLPAGPAVWITYAATRREGDVMKVHRRTRTIALVGLIGLVGVAVLGTVTIAGAHDDNSSKHKATSTRRSKQQAMADMPGMKMSGTKTDDKGLALLSNGHHHMIGTVEHALTPAERTTLSAQVSATIDTARQLPTVADALAAGYKQAGPYMPGIGAHYIHIGAENFNADGVMDAADLAHPLAIIYSGTDPTSVVAGFMYYSMSAKEPSGFAGSNDVWHYHEDLCLKIAPTGIETPYGLDKSATKKECKSAGGSLMKQTQWMVHVWSVPGWESRQGLFGEVNPALMCPDGTYYQYPPKGWLTHKMSACKSAP